MVYGIQVKTIIDNRKASSTSDSEPSEARKRVSGGGSPRKHDDLVSLRWGVLDYLLIYMQLKSINAKC
jgi:hypothetical protein